MHQNFMSLKPKVTSCAYIANIFYTTFILLYTASVYRIFIQHVAKQLSDVLLTSSSRRQKLDVPT